MSEGWKRCQCLVPFTIAIQKRVILGQCWNYGRCHSAEGMPSIDVQC